MTLVVLTLNEARNIEACLRSAAGWTRDLFVVDSGSSDETVAIAERCGARVVSHPFETHARQWTWALNSLPIATPWVLALDADQQVTPELADAISTALRAGGEHPAGYYLNRRQVFRGRWIRHGGYYPKYLLKLFRRSAVSIDEGDLVDHHFTVVGPTAKLAGDLIEDNRNEAEIAVWIAKHNRYAVLQARQEVRDGNGKRQPLSALLFGTPDARVLWMKATWSRLPLFVRPCLYVFYRYVLRLGFLDGREGFVFHVLQAFWYRLLVDVNMSEIRSSSPEDVRPAPEARRSVRPNP